jgi:hypothetical protein
LLNEFLLLLLFSNQGARLIDTVVTAAIECLEDIINVADGRAVGRFYLISFNFFDSLMVN